MTCMEMYTLKLNDLFQICLPKIKINIGEDDYDINEVTFNVPSDNDFSGFDLLERYWYSYKLSKLSRIRKQPRKFDTEGKLAYF